MKLRFPIFAAQMLAGFFAVIGTSRADTSPAPTPPIISTTTCSAYPQVSCSSADALACADALQLATDTRDQLSGLLQLGATWRFPVHIHVMTPDDPLTAKINREASAVFSQGHGLKIEAVLPSTDPMAREFIQRQYVTALLWEKFFAKTTAFDKETRLDVVPVWLVEGLREWLNEDTDHNRENIVKRAVQNKTAPTLAEVTNWHELSTDRLLGLWQRAFCFYLVDSLIQPGERRDDFQQWLSGVSGSSPSSAMAHLHFPTEAAWQHELDDSVARSRAIVYSWAETVSELHAAETITFADAKDAKVQTCTLDTIAGLPRTPSLIEAAQERSLVLTDLELRAHAGWQIVFEAYRAALSALVADHDPAEIKALFQKAHNVRVVVDTYHQKLLDYTNWYEVTKDYGDTTRFQSYFNTAQEMEKIEADPAHPNPIRANLLQLESEL